MPNAVSPGIYTREIDLTPTVQAVSTTEVGFAGIFAWGPIDKVMLITNEAELVQRTGKPATFNAETWFSGANFLAYGDTLRLVRAADLANTAAAVANTGAVTNVFSQMVKNEEAYAAMTFSANVAYVAKYAGEPGNSLKISVCDSAAAFSSNVALVANSLITNTTADTAMTTPAGSNVATIVVTSASNATVSNTTMTNILAAIAIGDVIEVGNTSIGRQFLKVTAKGSPVSTTNGANYISTATLSFDKTFNAVVNAVTQTVTRNWEYSQFVDRAPGTSFHLTQLGSTIKDELHVVVVDEDGKFTGVPGTILERFQGLSRATDAKTETGASNYYKTVLNNVSKYVWTATENANAVSNTAASVANSTNILPITYSFVGGTNGASEDAVSLSAITRAYDLFRNKEETDLTHIIMGKSRGAVLANYVVQNIAEVRQDCVVYISPEKEDVVDTLEARDNIVGFRNSITASSYAALDTGYKYQYDKYNDVFRWIPLNADVAGCAVRTATVAEPWMSPAGEQRGLIKNVVKLAYNPSEADRNVLYKNDVNPVVSFPGVGPMLYGDKTLLGRPSAFDRLNVRYLFIILRKAIARASRSYLFEINDEFTRAQFKNMVEPYLRDVKGRRGIYDFVVQCDENNNTGEVIDRNEFIASIYVKPARSINAMYLDFVAVKTNVEFSEVSAAA